MLRAEVEEKLEWETQARIELENQLQAKGKQLAASETKRRATAEARTGPDNTRRAEEQRIEIVGVPVKTVTCDCCGNGDVPENRSVRIDSGQVFCSDCLQALRQSNHL